MPKENQERLGGGLELRLSGFDIAINLAAQIGDRGKFYLVTQPVDESDFKFSAVKVFCEIEQVGFDVEFGVATLEGGSMPDIQHGPVGGVAQDGGVDRINTVGRQGEIGDI